MENVAGISKPRETTTEVCLVVTQQKPVDGSTLATWGEPQASAVTSDPPRVSADPIARQSVEVSAQQIIDAMTILGDPTVLLEVLQLMARDEGSRVQGNRIVDANDRAERAEKARKEAVKRAKEASGFLGLGKVLGGIVKAVVTAAAAAASVVTGGAGAAVALTGLALMLGAEEIAKGAAKLGLISQRDVAALTTALQIVGALCTLGTGIASMGAQAASAGATAANGAQQLDRVQQMIKKVADIIKACGAIDGGGFEVGNGIVRAERDGHKIDAKGAGADAKVSREDAAACMDALKEIVEQFGKIRVKFETMRDAAHETKMACIRMPG